MWRLDSSSSVILTYTRTDSRCDYHQHNQKLVIELFESCLIDTDEMEPYVRDAIKEKRDREKLQGMKRRLLLVLENVGVSCYPSSNSSVIRPATTKNFGSPRVSVMSMSSPSEIISVFNSAVIFST